MTDEEKDDVALTSDIMAWYTDGVSVAEWEEWLQGCNESDRNALAEWAGQMGDFI